MKLLSFGEIVWDVHGKNTSLGGAPLNLAVHTAVQGERAVLVSAVGNDAMGKDAIRIAADYGVDTACISVFDDMETAKCMVTDGENGLPVYELMRDASFDYIVMPSIGEYVDIIAFGTLSLRYDNNRRVISQMLKSIPHGDVFCDINLRAPFYSEETVRYCLSNATLLKVSDEELPDVGKIIFGEYCGLESTAGKLREAYPNIKLFIITLGENGASCFNGSNGEYYRCDAIKTEVVSTVGAGDSFSAAFLAHYKRENSIAECLEYASEIGSMVCADKAAFSMEMAERIRRLRQEKG